MKTITVKLEDDFFKQMKIKLINDDRSIQDYVMKLIEEDIKKAKK